MAQGICIYVEEFCGAPAPVFAELLTAARKIQEVTGEDISALIYGHQTARLLKEIQSYGVDHILVYEADHDPLLQDDTGAKVIAEMLKKLAPSVVLIPATAIGRSLFSRVAIRLNCGLTADCTELLVAQRENGSFYLKQNKPSFGDHVYVTITMREGFLPQMVTVRPGVYSEAEKKNRTADVIHFDHLSLPASGIEILDVLKKEAVTDSLSAAEKVVVCGRGMEQKESLELVKAFAEKIGAALACTRPLSDTGLLPFERQIGQTGCTIRPRVCISVGVSGAIQHTEGIKDVEQYVAINTDPNAAIFREADIGIVADANEVLRAFLQK